MLTTIPGNGDPAVRKPAPNQPCSDCVSVFLLVGFEGFFPHWKVLDLDRTRLGLGQAAEVGAGGRSGVPWVRMGVLGTSHGRGAIVPECESTIPLTSKGEVGQEG